jgi:signal transduction histidine kinase
LGLINTVRDIAKIKSGQFNLNLGEYALDNVVETVWAATGALAETKKLILKTEVAKSLPIGLDDEQRLTQVLLNRSTWWLTPSSSPMPARCASRRRW